MTFTLREFQFLRAGVLLQLRDKNPLLHTADFTVLTELALKLQLEHHALFRESK